MNAWAWLALLAALAIGCAIAARRDGSAFGRRLGRELHVVLFAAFYLGLVIYGERHAAIDDIGNRFLSPLAIPELILLAWLVESGLDGLSGWLAGRWLGVSSASAMAGALGATAILAIACLTPGFFRAALAKRQAGFGPSVYLGCDRPLFARLRDLERDKELIVYTNAPELAYFSGGAVSAWAPWRWSDIPSTRHPTGLRAPDNVMRERHAVLAWFKALSYRDGYVYTPDEIAKVHKLTPILRDADGALFWVGEPPAAQVRP